MRSPIPLIAVTLLLSTPLHAASTDAELDAFIVDTMAEAHIPGLSALVVRGDEVLWAGQYGFSRVEEERPVEADTLFMLASVSKTVIATSVMQLVEDGLIDLDQDVSAYVPFEVIIPDGGAGDVVTVRELLCHVSGIRDNWAVLSTLVTEGDSPIPLGRFMAQYLDVDGRYYYPRLNFYRTSAQGYHYSNVGASLAAYVVEAVSGMPFSDYTQAHIFEPLGMDETAWHIADLDPEHVAMPYEYSAAEGYVPQGFYGYPDYPDGGLRTSAPQLARYLMAHMEGGTLDGVPILSAESVAEINRVQYPELSVSQGLIWYYKQDDGQTYLGHNGGDAGVTTEMFYSPREEVGVILLLNGYGAATFRPLKEIERRLFDEAQGW